MSLRTGAQYLEALRDDRDVRFEGRRVVVPDHPALGGYARALAENFDVQREPSNADLLTANSPRTGKPMSRAWHLPRSAEDLARSREMFEFWERRCGGVLGRHPQYMAALVMGLYDLRNKIEPINREWSENIGRFFDHCRENDLSVAFSASDPTRARDRTPSPDEYLHLVEERPEGIVVSGAKMIATHAAYADEILSLTAGWRPEDTRSSLHFAVPAATPGLRIVCRSSFSHAGEADHPVSSRWDEMDAWILFDAVFVPRERVFLIGDHGLRPVSVVGTWGLFYGMLRVLVKAETMVGICFAVAEYLGTREAPQVQAVLAEALAFLESFRTVLREAEARPVFSVEGLAIPDPARVALARVLDLQSHARLVEIVREVCGTGLVTSPSELDLADPEIGPLVRHYIAGSDERAIDRFKMMKLAWEYTGDSFAGRQLVFEEHNAFNLAARRAQLLANYNAQPYADLATRLAGIEKAPKVRSDALAAAVVLPPITEGPPHPEQI